MEEFRKIRLEDINVYSGDPGCGVAFLGDYFSGSQRLDADGGQRVG